MNETTKKIKLGNVTKRNKKIMKGSSSLHQTVFEVINSVKAS